MATFDSLAAFNRELGAMSREMSLAKRKKITGPMADEAQKIIAAQLPKDLGGNDSFSGWTRKSPISLETKVKFTSEGAAIVHPTKVTAGPFTVAEDGRNKGNAAGFSGPGVNRRTGATSLTKAGNVRKQRSRKARRWNGYTAGKGTASKAVAAMESKMPKVAEDGVRFVIRRHFDVS